MGLDPSTLFFASGISAVALAMTMFGVWLQNRLDRFMVGWMAGMVMLGAGAVLYAIFPPGEMVITFISFTLETLGFVAVYISARIFTGRPLNGIPCMLITAAAVIPVALPIIVGLDGVGVAVFNMVAAVFLLLCAVEYWHCYREAPLSIVGLTSLYALAGLSFAACSAALFHDQQWVLHGRPDGLAEQINAVASIAGITGIGALSLALNQTRAARRHRIEAYTDALTGLMNRRALATIFAADRLIPGDAVIVFDLDRFKSINDQYGHLAGDLTLRQFAAHLRVHARSNDVVARLGGEEFVLVIRQVTVAEATAAAERIRAGFAAMPLRFDDTAVKVTVSAGIAFALTERDDLETVMHRADLALYRAKNSGRDRVMMELQVVA